MACQPIWGYFMPRGEGMDYILCNVHINIFCVISWVFFLHMDSDLADLFDP